MFFKRQNQLKSDIYDNLLQAKAQYWLQILIYHLYAHFKMNAPSLSCVWTDSLRTEVSSNVEEKDLQLSP